MRIELVRPSTLIESDVLDYVAIERKVAKEKLSLTDEEAVKVARQDIVGGCSYLIKLGGKTYGLYTLEEQEPGKARITRLLVDPSVKAFGPTVQRDIMWKILDKYRMTQRVEVCVPPGSEELSIFAHLGCVLRPDLRGEREVLVWASRGLF